MELSPFANQLYLVYFIENCHQRIKTTKKIISKAEDAVTLRKKKKKNINLPITQTLIVSPNSSINRLYCLKFKPSLDFYCYYS